MLSPKFFSFFKGLEKDNSKTYFDAHRKEYEQYVKEPFSELVQSLIDRMRKYEPTLSMEPKDAIFRLNRDIRFSKDKTPYKTTASAHISAHGRKATGRPGFYFEIGSSGGSIGGGVYAPEKDELEAVRQLIASEGKEFNKVIKAKKFVDYYGEIRGDRNKVVPAQFRDVAATNPLVANKQFFWWADVSKKDLEDKKVVDKLFDYYLAGKPAQDFLNRAFM